MWDTVSAFACLENVFCCVILIVIPGPLWRKSSLRQDRRLHLHDIVCKVSLLNYVGWTRSLVFLQPHVSLPLFRCLDILENKHQQLHVWRRIRPEDIAPADNTISMVGLTRSSGFARCCELLRTSSRRGWRHLYQMLPCCPNCDGFIGGIDPDD